MVKARKVLGRIENIKDTRKITKAMEMIASSKILSAQKRILESRPFMEKIEDFIKYLVFCSKQVAGDRLLKHHKNEKKALVLGITADRGLCGGYNSSAIKVIEDTIKKLKDTGLEVELNTIGTKGKNYFTFMGYELPKAYEHILDYPKFLDAREISRELISRFVVGEIDVIVVCYTRYENKVEQEPIAKQILPIPILEDTPPEEREKYGVEIVKIGDEICRVVPEFTFDPSPKEILESVIPEYIFTMIYIILLNCTASETAARMNSMRNASDNADKLTRDLGILYHKLRQEEITLELTEIVSARAVAEV